jgi:hypothetical protein
MSTPARMASSAPTGSGVPGTMGAPTSWAARRAAALSPIITMASGGGPTKVRPASPTARAKSWFSARNP